MLQRLWKPLSWCLEEPAGTPIVAQKIVDPQRRLSSANFVALAVNKLKVLIQLHFCASSSIIHSKIWSCSGTIKLQSKRCG